MWLPQTTENSKGWAIHFRATCIPDALHLCADCPFCPLASQGALVLRASQQIILIMHLSGLSVAPCRQPRNPCVLTAKSMSAPVPYAWGQDGRRFLAAYLRKNRDICQTYYFLCCRAEHVCMAYASLGLPCDRDGLFSSWLSEGTQIGLAILTREVRLSTSLADLSCRSLCTASC